MFASLFKLVSEWFRLDGSSQFANWFKNVFVKETAKLEDAKLLVFDNHNSHLTVPLIETATANNIELFCLPAHTSYALQSLDVRVFKSVKKSWRNILKEYHQETGYKNVDKVEFSSLLKKLVDTECFSRANVIEGFEGAGIVPLNKEKILSKCDTSKLLSVSENIEQYQEEFGTPSASGANLKLSHNL